MEGAGEKIEECQQRHEGESPNWPRLVGPKQKKQEEIGCEHSPFRIRNKTKFLVDGYGCQAKVPD